jgi:hypothetical protein
MSINNPSAINMVVPEYNIDQIIGVFSNTVNLGVPSAFSQTVATDSHAHGFGDSAYFQGIFTTDGSTWNDFGAQTPNLAPPNPEFQTVDVEAMCDATNINVYLINYYDIAHSVGNAYTITYKIYLMAKNTMANPLTPLKTNQTLYYNSELNYLKSFMQGTVAISVSSGNVGSTIVTHNLGYVPKVRAYFINSNQVYATNQVVNAISGGVPNTAPDIEVRITTTTVTFFSDQSGFGAPGINGAVDYRIYLDD